TYSSPALWTGSRECPPLQRTHVRAGSETTLVPPVATRQAPVMQIVTTSKILTNETGAKT
ncbi:TPA: hypothetical protein ACITIB_004775, partial [Salmonella enterica subsp. enterica serovar Typhimurium]